jgi:hypothetical protein
VNIISDLALQTIMTSEYDHLNGNMQDYRMENKNTYKMNCMTGQDIRASPMHRSKAHSKLNHNFCLT